MKWVVYNGGTTSCIKCSNPSSLVVGNVYEVTDEIVRDWWQTDYILKGIPGAFCSDWFDELANTYFAYSESIPAKGNSLKCSQVKLNRNHTISLHPVHTSTIREVEVVGNSTYRVITQNSIYLVTVM